MKTLGWILLILGLVGGFWLEAMSWWLIVLALLMILGGAAKDEPEYQARKPVSPRYFRERRRPNRVTRFLHWSLF